EMCGNMEMVYNQLNLLNSPVDDYLKIIFDNINNKLDKYEKNINECRATFEMTKLQLNRVRMGRTPAYSKQPQQCSECEKPYVYIKWCVFCDRKQFQQKFRASGNLEIDKFLNDSQQSITYPNGYVLNDSTNIRQDFFDEVSYGVLRCYGISKEPNTGNCVIVFPLAHGGDLRKYLKKRASNLNWVKRLEILRFTLYGLVEIHKKGMIHRDIHPGNLLHYRRTISVSDLGFTRPVNDIGTSLYQEVLGWLNKFDNDPDSEIVKQFEKNQLCPLDNTYSFSAKSVSKIIENDEKEPGISEHKNVRLKIMNDFSGENVQSIVSKYKLPRFTTEKLEMNDNIKNTNCEKQISSIKQSVQSTTKSHQIFMLNHVSFYIAD
ncbi:7155_t:CDS:2, partial [Racocetra persica]